MASTIQLKNGTGSAVPTSLAKGELAINVDSGSLYYGGQGGVSASFSFENITASKNIVANGTISASGDFHSFGGVIQSDLGIQIGRSSPLSRILLDSVNNVIIHRDIGANFEKPITASGGIGLANNTKISVGTNSTEIAANNDDYWVIKANGVQVANFQNNGAIFNEGGGSQADFRVETDNDTHAFFIDSGQDSIELGRSSGTHVTASGNISASGFIQANELKGDTNLDTGLEITGFLSAQHITASSVSASGNIKANFIETAKIPLIQYISDDTTSVTQGRVLAASSHDNETDSFALEWSTPLFEDTDFFETGSHTALTASQATTFAVKQDGRYEINCSVAFRGDAGARPGINLGIFTSSNVSETGSLRPAGPSAHAYVRVASPANGSTAAIPGFVIQLSSGSAVSMKVDFKDDWGGIGNTFWSGSLSHFNMKKIG